MRRTVSVVEILDHRSFRTSSGRIVVVAGVADEMPADHSSRQIRARLEELFLHRHVQLEEEGVDAQGRIMARVWVDGCELPELIAALHKKVKACYPVSREVRGPETRVAHTTGKEGMEDEPEHRPGD